MAAEKKAGAKPVDLVAVEPIQTGGRRFEPGEPLTVPAEEAESLLTQGAATPAKPSTKLVDAPAPPPAA